MYFVVDNLFLLSNSLLNLLLIINLLSGCAKFFFPRRVDSQNHFVNLHSGCVGFLSGCVNSQIHFVNLHSGCVGFHSGCADSQIHFVNLHSGCVGLHSGWADSQIHFVNLHSRCVGLHSGCANSLCRFVNLLSGAPIGQGIIITEKEQFQSYQYEAHQLHS